MIEQLQGSKVVLQLLVKLNSCDESYLYSSYLPLVTQVDSRGDLAEMILLDCKKTWQQGTIFMNDLPLAYRIEEETKHTGKKKKELKPITFENPISSKLLLKSECSDGKIFQKIIF